MEPEGSGAKIDDRTTRFAMSLALVLGEGAKSLADEEAAAALSDGTARSWRSIGATLRVFEEANAHMERALSLLDSVAELSVTPHLDHAIAKLGMRGRTRAEGTSGGSAREPG